ncbi:MAG: hypothetical protein PHF84_12705, partial [bacterium]|nr:hypothetical protein [bacterium]
MRVLFLLLLFCLNLYADLSGQGDALSVGQGGTTCFLDNASSAWKNPAQISVVTNREADLSCEFLYLGLEPYVYTGDTDYFNHLKFSFVYPLAGSRLGLGIDQFSSLYFKQSQFRLTFTERIKSLSLGLNLKYITYSYVRNDYTAINPYFTSDDLGAENISLDIGARLEVVRKKVFATLAILNVNQPDMGMVEEDRLKLQAVLGAGIRISRFSLSAELEYRDAKIDRAAFGVESTFLSPVFPLRAGFDNTFLPSIGCSFVIMKDPMAGLDYAARFFSD